MAVSSWYELQDASSVISPSLLVYPERILHNIRTMIEMAGGAEHLRPHIKTHKTGEIIKMQLEQGIEKFKCATIAEAELLAMCAAPDILLAMQPIGIDMERFFALMEKYPKSRFSALVDNLDTLRAFSNSVKSQGQKVSLWMDINTGMDRTGISPGGDAHELYRQMDADPNVEALGLHVYDGHIRNTDVAEREKICDQAFASVIQLKNDLEAEGISVAGLIAGGSPTFPFHAKRSGVQASPGTTLLWDAGYGGLFPEMEFLPAAVLLSRVISKPAKKVVCLDLGHKHLASEMPFPRVKFLGMDDSEKEKENIVQKGQSEEHFVLEATTAQNLAVGDVMYAIPMHICPTVAKYESLQVVSEGRIIEEWEVVARKQKITL